MNRLLALLVAIFFAWPLHAAPLSDLTPKQQADVDKACDLAQKYAACERAKIQADFDALQKRADALKAADKTYAAPWTPAAKRIDWQARDAILNANRPMTVDELAKAANVKPQDISEIMQKDATNQRKVFFKMSDGKYWVSSQKLPDFAPRNTAVKPVADLWKVDKKPTTTPAAVTFVKLAGQPKIVSSEKKPSFAPVNTAKKLPTSPAKITVAPVNLAKTTASKLPASNTAKIRIRNGLWLTAFAGFGAMEAAKYFETNRHMYDDAGNPLAGDSLDSKTP